MIVSRVLLVAMLCAAVAVQAEDIEVLDPNFASPDPDGEFVWYDALQIGLTGQGWHEDIGPYHRYPAKAEGVVRPSVWSLSRHSAGLAVRFQSDSPYLAARWSLTKENLAMPHMPATGVSGLDLYARDGGAWRWVAGARPSQQHDNTARLVSSTPGGMQEYLLYLPLYNGTAKLEIGVRPETVLAKAAPDPKGPMVFYGTSITQGGCASRPGMAYPAIIGRRLDRPTINLGFSGNGEMEPEVATLIAELDPAIYVLDALPNMSPEEVHERVAPFVHTLREAHPDTPIVLVENIIYQGSWFNGGAPRHVAKNTALKAEYESLLAAGVTGLYYLPCDDLLGDDEIATVDGVHPTDVGFLRQADAMTPLLQEILAE